MTESDFQQHLIRKLKILFPGCYVFKNDAGYMEGVPDLILLFEDRWAMLEVKASAKSRRSKAQEYYVERLDRMSFAAFIYPENEERILNEIQYSFQSHR